MIYANYTVAPIMVSKAPESVVAIALTSITERRRRAISDGPLFRWGLYEAKLMSDLVEVWPQVEQSVIPLQRNRPKLPDKQQVTQLEMGPSEVCEALVAPNASDALEALQCGPMVSLPTLDRTHTAAVVVSLLNSVQDYCYRLAFESENDTHEQSLSTACKYAACLQALFQVQIEPSIVDDWGRGSHVDGKRVPFAVSEDDFQQLRSVFWGTALQLGSMLCSDLKDDYTWLAYDVWRADDALSAVPTAMPSCLYPIRWMCLAGQATKESESMREKLRRAFEPFDYGQAASPTGPVRTLQLTPHAARGLAAIFGMALLWHGEARRDLAQAGKQVEEESAYVKHVAALHAKLLDIVGSSGCMYA